MDTNPVLRELGILVLGSWSLPLCFVPQLTAGCAAGFVIQHRRSDGRYYIPVVFMRFVRDLRQRSLFSISFCYSFSGMTAVVASKPQLFVLRP